MLAFWAHRGSNPTPKTPGSSVPTALVKSHVALWNWGASLTLKLRRQPWWFLNYLQSHSSLSERIVHVHSWRTLWSFSIGYKKSGGLPFISIFLSSLVPSGSVSVGISPSLFLASAEMTDQVYESHPWSPYQILSSHTLSVLFRTGYLFFFSLRIGWEFSQFWSLSV